MAHDVFVSHSSKDKIAADALVAHLERDGLRCWCAPRDIVAGASWASSIVRAINDCRVMVVVFSHNANASNHIRREVERAVNRGIPVVPVRIEDVMPQGDLEYFLSASHWMDAITPPVERHFDDLAARLRVLLSVAPAGPVADVPARVPLATAPRSPRRAPRRWALAGGAAAAVLLVAAVAVGWSIYGRTDPAPPHAGGSGGAATAPAATRPSGALAADLAEWQRLTRVTWSNAFFVDRARARFPDWLRAAEAGDPVGQLFAGLCYFDGLGVRYDPKTGFDWLLKAAHQGNADAMMGVSTCYEDGRGTARDKSQAYRWRRDAADTGNVRASVMNALADVFEGDGRFDPARLKAAVDAGYGDAIYLSALFGQFDMANPAKEFDRAAVLRGAEAGIRLGNPDCLILAAEAETDPGRRKTLFTRAINTIGDPQALMTIARGNAFSANLFPDVTLARLREVAAAGSCGAMRALAELYHDGRGAPKRDEREAVRWYSKAGDAGATDNYERVGDLYANAEQFGKDVRAAIEWWKKAATPDAHAKIGNAYDRGSGVPRDVPAAIQWWARTGDEYYYGEIAEAYSKGDGVPKDVRKAIEWWTKREDYWSIGEVYASGDGVTQDLREALTWWRRAAEASPWHARELALIYYNGKPLTKDLQQAAYWFERAAEKKDATAMAWLGTMYRDGTGVERNLGQARHWFFKSAAERNRSGLECLAGLFAEGLGVPKDQATADHLKLLSTDAWKPGPMKLVAQDLLRLGSLPNAEPALLKNAAIWYLHAATAGDAPAMREYARLLDAGRGVETDDTEAKKWWTKAADAGDAEALKRLGRTK